MRADTTLEFFICTANAATIFCISETGTPAVDGAADLPGPGAACVAGATALLP